MEVKEEIEIGNKASDITSKRALYTNLYTSITKSFLFLEPKTDLSCKDRRRED